eukprot:PITA_11170
MFLALKASVEKQSAHQILKLRSDNGGEYVNNKFINFCTEHGIQMQHIVPYTPQQNSVAERKNCTLKEMANCMPQSKGLILNFWAEAINCAKYIVNRTPTNVLRITLQKKHEAQLNHIEDDNPPPPFQDPHSDPQLPKRVCFTRDATGSLAGNPTDQRCTHSHFDRASSLLAQASTNYDPNTFAEALSHPNWYATMNEEYSSLLANDTWDLVPLPKGRKLVRCKWIYITKFGLDGKFDKHKARLVAKVFSQVEGIDYTETFSLIAKMNSIHFVLSLDASFKWEFHQMDVKSTFLHGDLHEEIYMEQPPGFIQIYSSLVCQLKKSLYSLKQAPQAWYAKMVSFLLDTGFSRCHSDNTVYTKKVGKSLIILVLYVDDLILTGSDPNLINHVNSSLKK